MSEWIKCSARMPPSYIDVLVTDGKLCAVGSMESSADCFLLSNYSGYGDADISFEPTHWQLLPAPPEI